jgi:hypothetical protein
MLLALLVGCAPAPLEEPAACVSPDEASWEGFGEGFFTTWCRSCHSASTADRRGAPEGLDFDTLAEVRAAAVAIEQSVLTDQDMPVGGGLAADDRALLQAFLACDDGATSTATESPPPAAGTLTRDEVVARADTALAEGLPRAEATFDVYVGILTEYGDPVCPFRLRLDAYQSTFAGCTTTRGWVFAGLTLRESGAEDGGQREWMVGDGFINDADGQRGVLGGELEWWAADPGDGPRAWWQTLRGTWGWEWEPGWYGEVPSFSLSYDGVWDGDEVTATVDGGITLGGASVYLDGVTVDSLAAPDAPVSGALLVRDDVGSWYTLVLREDGSGCGDIVDPAGVALGEGCPAWGPALASLRETP